MAARDKLKEAEIRVRAVNRLRSRLPERADNAATQTARIFHFQIVIRQQSQCTAPLRIIFMLKHCSMYVCMLVVHTHTHTHTHTHSLSLSHRHTLLVVTLFHFQILIWAKASTLTRVAGVITAVWMRACTVTEQHGYSIFGREWEEKKKCNLIGRHFD